MQVLEGLDARAQQGFGSIEDVQQPFFNPAAALPLFGDDSPAGVRVCVCAYTHTHTHTQTPQQPFLCVTTIHPQARNYEC